MNRVRPQSNQDVQKNDKLTTSFPGDGALWVRCFRLGKAYLPFTHSFIGTWLINWHVMCNVSINAISNSSYNVNDNVTSNITSNAYCNSICIVISNATSKAIDLLVI